MSGLELHDAGLVLASLQALRGTYAEAAASALVGLFEALGLTRLAEVMAEWRPASAP